MIVRTLETIETFHTNSGELIIHIPALPRPTLEELRRFRWIKSIVRDISTTEATELKVTLDLRGEFVQVFKTYADQYTGQTHRKIDRPLGFQHIRWLSNEERMYKCHKLSRFLEKVRIDCTGLVLESHQGVEYCAHLKALQAGGFCVPEEPWLGWDFHKCGE